MLSTSRTSQWIDYFMVILSITLFFSGCGESSNNDRAIIDTEIFQGEFKSVCDDMVYTIDFGDDYPELKQAAIDGTANFWLEDSEDKHHDLNQCSISQGKAILRIEGDLAPGIYELNMSIDGNDDIYIIDKTLEVRTPHIVSSQGVISPGETVDLTGSFFGKTQNVYLEYMEREGGEKKIEKCTIIKSPEEIDDPYDDSDENFPMDVSDGQSHLRIILPSTPATWIDPWIIIDSDNGRGMISLEAFSDVPEDGFSESLHGEDEYGTGRIFSIAQRGTLGISWRYGKYRLSKEKIHKALDNAASIIAEHEFSKKAIVEHMMGQSGFNFKDMDYPIALFDVQYTTRDAQGKKIDSSGVMIIPYDPDGRSMSDMPVLSFQHGTLLTKKEAPSASWGPELAYATLFAATGYITLVPDLPGMGLASLHKNDLHPYCQSKPIGYACADMLKTLGQSNFYNDFYYPDRWITGAKFSRSNGRVFLTGYSEGGYATMALFKELSQNSASYPGLGVIAVAAQAGPYSLSNVMRKKLMADSEFPVFYFAPYLIATLNKTTDLNYSPAELFAPSYTELYNLIDGYHSDKEVDKYEPSSKKPRDIFETGIRAQMDAGTGKFYEKLRENDLDSGWTMNPSTKVMLIHGTNDDCVPSDNSRKMKETFPQCELNIIHEDFSSTRFITKTLAKEKTLHELYFIYCMGEAQKWLKKNRYYN
jgi:pimeloyl-ACP methyl ester carboxylesterase